MDISQQQLPQENDTEISRFSSGDENIGDSLLPDGFAEQVKGIMAELEMPTLDPLLTLDSKRELGRGGLAVVWEANDETLGRDVAIKSLLPQKRMNPEFIRRLLGEARATAQLEHPNIVPVYSLGIDDKLGVYFTMKKLDGETLRNICRQLYFNNPDYVRDYPPSRLMTIFVKICQGMAFVHSRGVIHRDLKPENILVGKYGEVTIIDWGLIRKVRDELVLDDSRQGAPLAFTPKNTLSVGTQDTDENFDGTPRYMAPEQITRRNRDLDCRCDIYALGVILYELLTFRNPFSSLTDEAQILDAVSNGRYLRPRQHRNGRGISPELEAICLKAMSLKRSQRYACVDDLIQEIYNAQSLLPITAYRPSLFHKFRNLIKAYPFRSAIVLGILVAIAAATITIYVINALAMRDLTLEPGAIPPVFVL